MTTGSISINQLYPVKYPLPEDPSNTVSNGGGSIWVKNWGGADYPAAARVFAYAKPQSSPSRGFKPSSRKPRKRDMVPHPYNMTATTQNADLMLWKGKYYGNNQWEPSDRYYADALYSSGGIGSSLTGPDPWSGEDQNALLGKLREAVAGSDFNAGVFLAEMPEAFRMIAGAATNLAKAYRQFRKGNFAGAADTLGKGSGRKVRASNRWLEMQYGWMPLLQDMEGGARFIARLMSQPVVRVSASHRCRKFSGYGSGTRSYLQAGSSYQERYGTLVVDFAAIDGIRSKQIIAYLKTVDQLELAGLTDPLGVAWELVPFSFVVDWAFPIGRYLSNLSLDRALSATFVTTDLWRVEGSGLRMSGASTPGRYIVSGGENCHNSSIRLIRTVDSGLSIPRPFLRGAEKVLSLNHALNALALLDSVFRK